MSVLYANANKAGTTSLPELLLRSIQMGANEPKPGAYQELELLINLALNLANGTEKVTAQTNPIAVSLAVALKSEPKVLNQIPQSSPLTKESASELLTVVEGLKSGSPGLFTAP